jgi:arylsulfatase A-like enzyme
MSHLLSSAHPIAEPMRHRVINFLLRLLINIPNFTVISRMDIGVGLILDLLKERSLDKNTMVILVSDNGAPFLNSKTTLYDAGVKLPLIVKCPANDRGVTNPNLVSFLDILPSCIDWASIDSSAIQTPNTSKSPPRLGKSFISILASNEVYYARLSLKGQLVQLCNMVHFLQSSQ